MKDTEAKRKAQDILMDVVAVAYYRLEDEDYSEQDKEVVRKQLKKQADRIAKMFGFSESWTY